MYHVLLPVDEDSDRARSQAEYVAGLPDAAASVEVTLLHVFGDDGADIPDEFKRSATRVSAVRRAEEHLEKAGVEVHVLDDSGDAAERILATADDREVDEIVVGGRKRSSVGKAIFGSVTQAVLRGTSIPVVVTGPVAD